MKRKFVLMLTLLFVGISTCISQERVNKVKLNFDKQSELLDSVVGWKYNILTGVWVDYRNMICEDQKLNEYITKGRSYFGFGPANGMHLMSRFPSFFNIQTKTIPYNQKDYYVLIMAHCSGYYRYPNLKEDWISYFDTTGFILDRNEYLKLFDNDTAKKSIKVLSVVHNGYLRQNSFNDKIQLELENINKSGSFTCFINCKNYKNNVVRFSLPALGFKYSMSSRNNDITEIHPPGLMFPDEYFETNKNNFNKLLIK